MFTQFLILPFILPSFFTAAKVIKFEQLKNQKLLISD